MARPKKSAAADDISAPACAPGKFVLQKNHGLVTNGRSAGFYEAGTEFDVEADKTLIAQLVQSGANFEIASAVEDPDESAEQPQG